MSKEIKMTQEFALPVVVQMDPLPPNNNPYHHDLFHMGCGISGAWEAMFSGHSGIKQEHNMSEAEKEAKARGESVWYDDPSYIIFINKKTGQRFKLVFKFDKDNGDLMNALLRQHEAEGKI